MRRSNAENNRCGRDQNNLKNIISLPSFFLVTQCLDECQGAAKNLTHSWYFLILDFTGVAALSRVTTPATPPTTAAPSTAPSVMRAAWWWAGPGPWSAWPRPLSCATRLTITAWPPDTPMTGSRPAPPISSPASTAPALLSSTGLFLKPVMGGPGPGTGWPRPLAMRMRSCRSPTGTPSGPREERRRRGSATPRTSGSRWRGREGGEINSNWIIHSNILYSWRKLDTRSLCHYLFPCQARDSRCSEPPGHAWGGGHLPWPDPVLLQPPVLDPGPDQARPTFRFQLHNLNGIRERWVIFTGRALLLHLSPSIIYFDRKSTLLRPRT